MDTATEKELTLQDLFSIFRRRQKIVYGTLLAFVVLGVLYCAISTRRYESSGTIQVQKQGSDAMGLESMMTGAADSASGCAWREHQFADPGKHPSVRFAGFADNQGLEP